MLCSVCAAESLPIIGTILPRMILSYAPPLSPRLLRLEAVRGLPCPLVVVGTSHELWLVNQSARIISRAPIDAARGYSEYQSSMRCACCGLNAAYNITTRADTQGGV